MRWSRHGTRAISTSGELSSAVAPVLPGVPAEADTDALQVASLDGREHAR
jgi:hypothetical protein